MGRAGVSDLAQAAFQTGGVARIGGGQHQHRRKFILADERRLIHSAAVGRPHGGDDDRLAGEAAEPVRQPGISAMVIWYRKALPP